MNRVITLALCALAPLAVHAGALQVSVLDRDGKPVPDAVVVLVSAAAGASQHAPLPLRATISQEKDAVHPRGGAGLARARGAKAPAALR